MKTYRVGTVVDVDGSWAILSCVGVRKAALIDINDGNRWEEPIRIKNPDEVTHREISRMACGNKYHIVQERI